MPDADYWTGKTSNAWEVGLNWSLNRPPTDTDDAMFDSTRLINTQNPNPLPCTLSTNVTVASVVFAANLPASTVLSIANGGQLQTPDLTIDARTAGQGTQAEIQLNGQLVVATDSEDPTAGMAWYGGDISGSGGLVVSAAAVGDQAGLIVAGSSAADMPTLGVPLQLNSGDGGGTCTMDFNAAKVQPLVVKGNASITVYSGATLQFDGQPLQQGSVTVTAITAGDTAAHIIDVAGGTVKSDGTYKQVVGTGIEVESGWSRPSTLEADGGVQGQALEKMGFKVGTPRAPLRVKNGVLRLEDNPLPRGINLIYDVGWMRKRKPIVPTAKDLTPLCDLRHVVRLGLAHTCADDDTLNHRARLCSSLKSMNSNEVMAWRARRQQTERRFTNIRPPDFRAVFRRRRRGVTLVNRCFAVTPRKSSFTTCS